MTHHVSASIPDGNIFSALPDALAGELFQQLVQQNGIRVERIISRGHTTPEGEWYDQEWDEWVLLLSGEAELLLEGEPAPCRLVPGDYLLIPARRRHRVTRTAPHEPTIWLAVHFPEHATNG